MKIKKVLSVAGFALAGLCAITLASCDSKYIGDKDTATIPITDIEPSGSDITPVTPPVEEQPVDNPNVTETPVAQTTENHIHKTFATMKTKWAGCGVEGEGYKYCTTCGARLENVTFPSLGEHSYQYLVSRIPTKTSTGILTKHCTKCYETSTIVLPKVDEENYTSYTKSESVSPCTTSGIIGYTYEVDNQTIDIGYISMETFDHHNWTNYTIAINPSSSLNGVAQRKCLTCGAFENYVLPAFNEAGNDVYELTVTVEPTCISTGKGYYSLKTETGLEFEAEYEIPTSDHTYGPYYIISKPTMFETVSLENPGDTTEMHSNAGQAVAYCTYCGFANGITLPPLNSGYYTVENVSDATCTTTGLAKYSITLKGETFTIDYEVPKLGHEPVAKFDYTFTYAYSYSYTDNDNVLTGSNTFTVDLTNVDETTASEYLAAHADELNALATSKLSDGQTLINVSVADTNSDEASAYVIVCARCGASKSQMIKDMDNQELADYLKKWVNEKYKEAIEKGEI